MPLFPRITTELADMINILLHLLVARAFVDRLACPPNGLPPPLRNFSCDMCFDGTSPRSTGWTCGSLLTSMGPTLACWTTSPLTTAVKDLITAAPSHAFVNIYLAAIMGSAAFAHALTASGACSAKRSAQAKVRAAVRHHPHHPAQLVDISTRAGRVLHDRLSALPLAQARALLVAAFTVTPSKVLLKQGRTWRPKRTIVKTLSALCGFGPYTTSVFWQYYRLAVRYPANADLTFAACGPGCRSGINWFFGHPPDLCKEARGPSIEHFFSSRLELLLPYCRRCEILERLTFRLRGHSLHQE